MLAVVQIGSNTRKSACMTARSVLFGGGTDCALERRGQAAAAAPAAKPDVRTVRLVATIVMLPCLVFVEAYPLARYDDNVRRPRQVGIARPAIVRFPEIDAGGAHTRLCCDIG